MDSLPPEISDAFRRDYRVVQLTLRSAVVPGRAQSSDVHWDVWLQFCASLGIDPFLRTTTDPIPLLQVFAARYRSGIIAPSHRPVRSRTVEDALRSVGSSLTSMGAPDPRLDRHGSIDRRLHRLLQAYTRSDSPPSRVKPVPVRLLFAVTTLAFHPTTGTPASQATADMAIIAFFFLLRPGEYTGGRSPNPFRLQDVQIFIGSRRLPLTSPVPDIQAATHVSLTFSSQKNGVRGEILHHGRSGHRLACPVQAIIRRLLHLRANNAPLPTPLATYFLADRSYPVTATDISSALRLSSTALGPSLGFLPSDVSARSLRAGGAMALLCANVDTDIIRLLGRWHSDAMMRYLHLQAQPVMQGFASKMLSASDYNLHPGPSLPL